MADNVVYLHGQPEPVGHFLRIGNSGHRQVETLLASGRMPLESVVIDASATLSQAELLSSLRDHGRELILDTDVAELSAEGRYDGVASGAPWANPQRPLQLDDFDRSNSSDIVGKIARFAVEHGFHAVLAPTHPVDRAGGNSLSVDRVSCVALRKALDNSGGHAIGIDYPILTKNAVIRDPVQRQCLPQ